MLELLTLQQERNKVFWIKEQEKSLRSNIGKKVNNQAKSYLALSSLMNVFFSRLSKCLETQPQFLFQSRTIYSPHDICFNVSPVLLYLDGF